MKPHPSRAAPALFLALALGACGGDSADDSPAGGVAGLDAPDFELAVEAPTLFRLGGFEAEGWEQFGELGPAGFDAAGNLYLLDRQAGSITVVDSTGALVRTFARQGNGPGELASPMGMAVFPDGRVVVSDLGNRGFVLFGADGTFDRLVPFQATQFATTIAPLASGDVFQSGGGVRIAIRSQGSEAPAEPTTRPVVRYSLEDAAVDTLWNGWMMPPPDVPDGPPITLPGGGGASITLSALPPLRAFEAPLLAAALPDGRVAVVDSVDYAVKVVREGSAEAVLRRPVPPQAVTPGIEAAEQERRLAALEDGSARMQITIRGAGGAGGPIDASAMERARIEGMVFAPEIPVVAGLAVDPQGRIWVERTGAGAGRTGPIDIITPEGDYLGTIPPDGLRIPTAFGPGGLVAWITRDEYDAAVVEVGRLPAEWVSPD